MKWLKNLLIAHALCRKYRVGLSLQWIPKGEGSYCQPSGRPFIIWCPFDKEAMPILFHEFGHHVDYKRNRSDIEVRRLDKSQFTAIATLHMHPQDKPDNKISVFSVMHREANASQFAIRAMRSLGIYTPTTRQYLWYAFTTYTNAFYKYTITQEERLAFTNLVTSCCMKILNRR